MIKEFRATLVARGPGGAWTFLPIPFKVEEAFGTKARVPVSGTVNGFAFRNSLMPEGDGTHAMMFSRALQAGAQARAGDVVRVVLRRDNEERTVQVPDALRRALRRNKPAAATFAGLSYSQKREFADWISSAKQEATREGRLARAVELLAAGTKRLR
jgi:hypothetical protein